MARCKINAKIWPCQIQCKAWVHGTEHKCMNICTMEINGRRNMIMRLDKMQWIMTRALKQNRRINVKYDQNKCKIWPCKINVKMCVEKEKRRKMGEISYSLPVCWDHGVNGVDTPDPPFFRSAETDRFPARVGKCFNSLHDHVRNGVIR